MQRHAKPIGPDQRLAAGVGTKEGRALGVNASIPIAPAPESQPSQRGGDEKSKKGSGEVHVRLEWKVIQPTRYCCGAIGQYKSEEGKEPIRVFAGRR